MTADNLLRHAVRTEGGTDLVLGGRAPSHVEPSYRRIENAVIYPEDADAAGMAFELRVRVLAEGGVVEASDTALTISGADAVALLVSAATGFNGPERSPAREGVDPAPLARAAVDAVSGRGYAELLARHQADHRALFRRVELELASLAEVAELATDARILRQAAGEADPALAVLLFHYGRYLLIASSRPGGQPANLAECHEPLFDLIEGLARNGRRTAEVNYGARGWVSHHNADLWRQTGPVGAYGEGDPMWANWCMSGAWLCQHLDEHVAYGGDEVFLRERAWAVMKGSAEFFLDWLVEDADGKLVTAPSTSPKIGFITPSGVRGAVTHGSTMDLSIIHNLFTRCIAVAGGSGSSRSSSRGWSRRGRCCCGRGWARAGSCRSGWRILWSRTCITGTSRIFSACIRARRSRRASRGCLRRRVGRWSCAATTARAGRWRGRSISGRGFATATGRTS